MVNSKEDKFAFNVLLQVRVNQVIKNDIDTYIEQENKKGRKYSQSDFLRDAILAKLRLETKDIEERMAKGVIIGEIVKDGWKAGKVSDETLDDIFYGHFRRFAEENIDIPKLREFVEHEWWRKAKESMIKHFREYTKLPEEIRQQVIADLEKS